MTIGLAQTKLDTDLPAAKTLIAEAHDDAKNALVELRNVVRGIAPTILSDRGLDAALSSVRRNAAAVPTALNVDLPRRLPDEVEACAYFVVAEALTNVAKHAHATQAVVTVRLDDAVGPAVRVGVRRRSRRRSRSPTTRTRPACAVSTNACAPRAARFTVSSPATGPTIVTAVLPCAS